MPKPPPRFEHIEGEYQVLWDNLQIRSSWAGAVDRRAKQIIGQRDRYEEVEALTGVPWYMIGCIHSMESGLNFSRHLHNGDSLQKRTWRVPAGRPRGRPPFTWEESSQDALNMKGLYKISDWSIPRVLYELERYNGWGYRLYHSSVKSPYLWSGSQYYRAGKYVADGKWSSSAVSGQTGAACLMRRIFDITDMQSKPAAPMIVPLPERKPELDPVQDIEPVPSQIEDDDPNPVPKAGPTSEAAPVKEAVQSSRTITGGLLALFGSVVQWGQEAASALLESAAEITALAPAKTVLASLGGNVGSISFGIAVFGVALVVFRRLDAANKGKVG